MTEDTPQFDRDVLVDRAGVGFLFCYAQPRETVNNFVRFDLQLPSQLINSDFVHINETLCCGDAAHSPSEWRTSDSS